MTYFGKTFSSVIKIGILLPIFILLINCSNTTQDTTLDESKNYIKIVSILPDPSKSLQVGNTVDLEITVKYVINDPSGAVTLVVQKGEDGGMPLANEMEVVTKGKGSVTLKKTLIIPETKALKVFTPLVIPGTKMTTTVDSRFYKVVQKEKDSSVKL